MRFLSNMGQARKIPRCPRLYLQTFFAHILIYIVASNEFHVFLATSTLLTHLQVIALFKYSWFSFVRSSVTTRGYLITALHLHVHGTHALTCWLVKENHATFYVYSVWNVIRTYSQQRNIWCLITLICCFALPAMVNSYCFCKVFLSTIILIGPFYWCKIGFQL